MCFYVLGAIPSSPHMQTCLGRQACGGFIQASLRDYISFVIRWNRWIWIVLAQALRYRGRFWIFRLVFILGTFPKKRNFVDALAVWVEFSTPANTYPISIKREDAHKSAKVCKFHHPRLQNGSEFGCYGVYSSVMENDGYLCLVEAKHRVCAPLCINL